MKNITKIQKQAYDFIRKGYSFCLLQELMTNYCIPYARTSALVVDGEDATAHENELFDQALNLDCPQFYGHFNGDFNELTNYEDKHG